MFCCESKELKLRVYFDYYYTQSLTTRRNSTLQNSLIIGLHWENGAFPHFQLDKSSLSRGYQRIACAKHLFLVLTKVIYKWGKHKQCIMKIMLVALLYVMRWFSFAVQLNSKEDAFKDSFKTWTSRGWHKYFDKWIIVLSICILVMTCSTGVSSMS